MAGSCLPGPTCYNPFITLVPTRAPGSLSIYDAADPNASAIIGDTPGSLGMNDHAELIAHGTIGANRFTPFGNVDPTEFMCRVYEKQLNRALKKKQFFPGLSLDHLEVVEGKHRMRKDVARACRALLAQARADLKKKQQENDKHALTVKSIGVASAYRDPERDTIAWEGRSRSTMKTQNMRGEDYKAVSTVKGLRSSWRSRAFCTSYSFI